MAGMRRWNGWGDESIRLKVPARAIALLRARAGDGRPHPDAEFASVVATVPESRLPASAPVDTAPSTRLLHARGQSLPDWFALRFGRVDSVPDGVAFPESSEDVRSLLEFAKSCGARVVPYGGGTSVVGGVTPPDGDAPVITLSLARMRRLIDLDPLSRLATFASGVTGPDLEAQLRVHGFTLGHFPQSFEYSTLGGWIVTRSSGQQSLRYGRIEQTFAGGRVETPAGTLAIPTVPASAAGIDLRELVLGSEGRLGVVTEAVVRVRPVPKHESFHGWFFPDWDAAEDAVRALVQSDSRPALSMLRLANPLETLTTLRLARGGVTGAALERFLALRGIRDRKCLLLIGVTGASSACRTTIAEARSICGKHGAAYFGRRLGERWSANRFRGVYFRNSLWESGYAVDTLETAVDWQRVRSTMDAVESAVRDAFGDERVHAYSHLSHVYPQGSSVYSTFIFPIVRDYEANLSRWRALKRAASEAIVRCGGTISHQHGVGIDHRPYLGAEKGLLGIEAMRAVFGAFDPAGIMNPGKLA
jgi:alkyldihydroxyacetonephosphate synthase